MRLPRYGRRDELPAKGKHEKFTVIYLGAYTFCVSSSKTAGLNKNTEKWRGEVPSSDRVVNTTYTVYVLYIFNCNFCTTAAVDMMIDEANTHRYHMIQQQQCHTAVSACTCITYIYIPISIR